MSYGKTEEPNLGSPEGITEPLIIYLHWRTPHLEQLGIFAPPAFSCADTLCQINSGSDTKELTVYFPCFSFSVVEMSLLSSGTGFELRTPEPNTEVRFVFGIPAEPNARFRTAFERLRTPNAETRSHDILLIYFGHLCGNSPFIGI